MGIKNCSYKNQLWCTVIRFKFKIRTKNLWKYDCRKHNCYKYLNWKSHITNKSQKLESRRVETKWEYANFLISHGKGSIDKNSASIHISPWQDNASGFFLWIPSTNLLTNSVFKGRTKTSHHNIFISKFKNKKTF